MEPVNLDPRSKPLKGLHLLACDICRVDETRGRLEDAAAENEDCRLMITTEGIDNSMPRRRAVALEICRRAQAAAPSASRPGFA